MTNSNPVPVPESLNEAVRPAGSATQARCIPFRAIAVAAACSLVLLSFLRPGELTCDDAFISFRYAENLASGRGLVFNRGERVEGYSNLSYVLLLALLHRLSLPTILAANLAGAAAGLLLLAATMRLAAALGAGALPAMATGVAVGLTNAFQGWCSRGLETVLFPAILTTAIFLITKRAARAEVGILPAILLGLLGVTRPEGILYIGCTTLWLCATRRSRVLRFVSIALLPVIAQLLFRIVYYRDLLPNPYYVKLGGRSGRFSSGLIYLLDYRHAGTLLCLLLLLGLLAAFARRRTRLIALAASAGLFFVVMSGGEGYPDHRFLVPVLPLLFVGAAGLDRFRIMPALLLLIVAVSPAGATARRTVRKVILPGLDGTPSARTMLAHRLQQMGGVGSGPIVREARRLREAFDTTDLLAISDCGRIPYVSGLRTLDLVGLMNRDLARRPWLARADAAYPLLADPAVVILHLAGFWHGSPLERRLAGSRRFLSRYRLSSIVALRGTAYYRFERSASSPPAPFFDLTCRVQQGAISVEGGASGGAGSTRKLVQPVFRKVDLPQAEELRMAALVTPGPLPRRRILTIERAFHQAANATTHGIRFVLPEGVSRLTLKLSTPPYPTPMLRGRITATGALLEVRSGSNRRQFDRGPVAIRLCKGSLLLTARRPSGSGRAELFLHAPEIVDASPGPSQATEQPVKPVHP